MPPTRASDRGRGGLLRLVLPLALPLAGGCRGSRDAIANLDALYANRTGERALYAKEVPSQSLFSGKDAKKEVDDPVEFAIENLGELRDSPESLDVLERTRGLGVACEMGRIDPSRIVRKMAYDTALVLWGSLPARPFRFEARSIDETALNADLDALLSLATASPESTDLILERRGADLLRGAAALEAVAPDRFDLAHKLLLLAAKCGRIASNADGQEPLATALTSAAEELCGHVAYLSARIDMSTGHGIIDSSAVVQASAGELLIAVDPVAATVDLGEVFTRVPDGLVRIAWLEALSDAPMRAAAVHPKLREPIALCLEWGDASTEFWARQTMAHLLGVDPEQTSTADLRSRWSALGEWDPQARP